MHNKGRIHCRHHKQQRQVEAACAVTFSTQGWDFWGLPSWADEDEDDEEDTTSIRAAIFSR
jgi:hypothetical protein